jgi:hypothetical protein
MESASLEAPNLKLFTIVAFSTLFFDLKDDSITDKTSRE